MGQCVAECPENFLLCLNAGEQVCVDPATSPQFCGASEDCAGGNRGAQCAPGEACVNGQCACSACPPVPHAVSRCVMGQCGRGPCEPGWFDFDAAAPGCETSCTGRTCVRPDGSTLQLTDAPVVRPEAPVAGSTLGANIQTNSTHSNTGIVGEPTPLPVGGAVLQQNSNHVNMGGIHAFGR